MPTEVKTGRGLRGASVRTVSAAPVVAVRQPTHALPRAVLEVLDAVARAPKAGLLDASVEVALVGLQELLEAEVSDIVGPKGTRAPGRTAVRHGHVARSVTLGGRRISVRRPRVRTVDRQHEVRLRTYAHFAAREQLTVAMLERMLVRIAARRYAHTGQPADSEPNAISEPAPTPASVREFLPRTRRNLTALMSRPLDDPRLAVVMLAGIELEGRRCVLALGIDAAGATRPVGVWDGSAENATVARAVVAELRERCLDVGHVVPVVVGEAKALREALRVVFGTDVPARDRGGHDARQSTRRLRAAWTLEGRGRAMPLPIAFSAAGASAAVGAMSTQPRAMLALLAALGVAAGAFLAIRARGILLGVLLLAVANAIPGVDLGKGYALAGLPMQDIAILVIIALLAQGAVAGGAERLRRPWVRPAIAWGCVLAAWWLLTWLRSVDAEAISPKNAALFGRDFLYFALLVPLALAGLERREVPGLAAVVIAGGALTSLGQIATVLGGGRVSFLIHVIDVKREGGLPRIYSQANDLVILLVALGLGLVLLGRTAMLRRFGVATALIAGFATVLMQTRAIYATVPTALLAVTVFLMARPSPVGIALRRGAGRVLVAVAVSIALVVLVAPEVFTSSTFGQVTERALSGLSTASEETGTLAYRQQLADTLLQLLGGKWPIGLGFLHPNDFYVAGVPFGSIRNSDLGILEAVMPMGALGAALLYVPPLIGTWALLRRLGAARSADGFTWLGYGVTSWVISVLLGSITLVTLFVPGGMTYVAVLLGAALVCLTPGGEPSAAAGARTTGRRRAGAIARPPARST
jgi:Transposase, Mutator family